MKKFIYALLALPTLLFASCEAEMGSEPGTDKTPVVTVYSYPVAAPNNPDSELRVRFATNSATRGVMYYVLPTSEVAKFVKEKGAAAFVQEIKSKGTKVEANGAQVVDVIVGGMVDNRYSICSVAANSTDSNFVETQFGYSWTTKVEGTFKPNQSFVDEKEILCVLQQADQDKSLYRIKGAFGQGKDLKFSVEPTVTGGSGDDAYTGLKIGVNSTPYAIQLKGDTDPRGVWVSDIATWQKNDGFRSSTTYFSVMFDKTYDCIFNLAWSSTDDMSKVFSYGTMSNGQSSYFIPNAGE